MKPSMALEGYTPWCKEPPPRDAYLQFFNEYSRQRWTGTANDLPPGYATESLWWRKCGIARSMEIW